MAEAGPVRVPRLSLVGDTGAPSSPSTVPASGFHSLSHSLSAMSIHSAASSTAMDDTGSSGSPIPGQGPTPRRRLSNALRMDAEASKYMDRRGSMSGAMTSRDAPAEGEELVKRIGKKIDGRYSLVSIFVSASRIRLVVYFQVNCQKNELICTLDEAEFPPEEIEKRATLISAIIAGLQLDAESNKPMLVGSIPVTWVAR